MPDSKLLPSVKIETGPKPAHTLIWMHGLGADGNDFVPIVKELSISSKKSLRFVFPHAPEQPVTINNGYVMRAWYDIYGLGIGGAEDEAGIRASQESVDALIEHELQRGITSDHIVLAGFSQGGVMALHTGLRQKNKLGGIMALSCYLPLATFLSNEAESINSKIPIFMAHGVYDDVVPLQLATSSKAHLDQAHYTVEWHEYGMAHSVCAEEIMNIDQWLSRILV